MCLLETSAAATAGVAVVSHTNSKDSNSILSIFVPHDYTQGMTS